MYARLLPALLLAASFLAGCAPETFRATDITGAGFARTLELTGHDGKAHSLADFRGKVVVVFFVFTHCPDICPNSMYALAEALAQEGGYDVQPILITVDPERDTPERMREYTSTDGFPRGLAGLSGSRAQVDFARR